MAESAAASGSTRRKKKKKRSKKKKKLAEFTTSVFPRNYSSQHFQQSDALAPQLDEEPSAAPSLARNASASRVLPPLAPIQAKRQSGRESLGESGSVVLQKQERNRKNLREVFRENLGTPYDSQVSELRG